MQKVFPADGDRLSEKLCDGISCGWIYTESIQCADGYHFKRSNSYGSPDLKHAEEYHIDVDNIFIMGDSSGGILLYSQESLPDRTY